MRWGAQALHVARKDMRMTRWFIAGYALLVWTPPAWAALRGSVQVGQMGLTLLTMFAGLLLVATAVQADSPARSDAFWVTRPLDPTAVLAGKLLYALAVPIGIALPAQMAGFALHDVAARQVPEFLALSVAVHGSALVLAIALATLTRDLRGFIVALLAMYVALLLGAMLREAVTDAGVELIESETLPIGSRPATLFIGLMLLLAVHQYRTRHVRRGILLAVGLVAFWSITGPALPMRRDPPTPASVPQGLRAGVRGELVDRSAQMGRASVAVHLEVDGGAPDHEYVLRDIAGGVRRADGTVEPLGSLRVGTLVLRAGPRLRMQGVGQMLLYVSDAQAAELRQGTARLELGGSVGVRAPETLGSFPASGGTFRRDGLRIGGVRFSRPRDGDSIQIAFAESQIGDTCEPHAFGHFRRPCSIEYMLVDVETGATVGLQPSGYSGDPAGLAMFGPPSMARTLSFRVAPEDTGPATDHEPLSRSRTARSRIALVRWRDVGEYPMRIEAAIRD